MYNSITKNNFQSIKELLSLLKKQQISIFCGAGISLNPPSNLPIANMLRKEIVHCLFNKYEYKPKVQNILEFGKDKNTNIIYPFEFFIQSLNNQGRFLFLDSLINIYSGGVPNKNHTFLAHLIDKNFVQIIMTTNFDTKIEDTLESLSKSNYKWEKDINYKVLSDELHFYERYLKMQKVPLVIHLHGNIKNKNSLRTTPIKLEDNILKNKRYELLNYFFSESNKDILILGYSGNDAYDINPILNKIRSKKRIYYIRHHRINSEILPGVYSLTEPFNNFEGITIRVNTDELINFFWDNLFDFKWLENNAQNKWEEQVIKWYNNLWGHGCYIIFNILYDCQSFFDIEHFFLYLLKNKMNIYDSLCILGRYCLLRGNLDIAEKYYKYSLKYSENNNIFLYVNNSYFHLGNIYYMMGNVNIAKRHYIKYLQEMIAKRTRDKYELTEINIGLGYYMLAKIALINNSVKESLKLYNASRESMHPINLEGYETSEIISENHIFEREFFWENISDRLYASILIYENKIDEAKILANKCIEYFYHINNVREIYISLLQIAEIEYINNNHNFAIESLEKSYNISNLYKDEYWSTLALLNLYIKYGIIYDQKKIYNLYNNISGLSKIIGINNLIGISTNNWKYLNTYQLDISPITFI
jgi:hypothetical protein